MSNGIQAYKARASAMRARLTAAPTERKVGLVVAGILLGNLERTGTLPIQIMGLPTKPALGVLAAFVEANSSGMMQRAAGAVADTNFAVYSYLVAKGGTLIAGEGDDPEGDTNI